MPLDVRDDLPVQTAAASPPVWWCPRGEKHVLSLLAAPKWVPVHWLAGRSRACTGDADCPPKWHERPVAWRGYLPAIRLRRHPKSGVLEWLPVTLEIGAETGARFRDRGCVYEGTLIRLERDRDAKSPARVFIGTADDRQKYAPPPVATWDVMPSLLRLWGIAERDPEAEGQPLRLWPTGSKEESA